MVFLLCYWHVPIKIGNESVKELSFSKLFFMFMKSKGYVGSSDVRLFSIRKNSFIFLAFSNRSDAKLYIYVTIK